jgi:hypothetical protein
MKMNEVKRSKWTEGTSAGYATMFLDAGSGEWQVYKVKRRWIAVFVVNKIGRLAARFSTKGEAIEYAEGMLVD